ncbi:discoidin domain-containing protein [Actinoplanes flavus]|nr:discoidin domain-containing protein [Actinoplanes flavus]
MRWRLLSAAVLAVVLAVGYTGVAVSPAHAAQTPMIPATVVRIIIDDTTGTPKSQTQTALQLGFLTVVVDDDEIAALPPETKIKVTVPGASTPEQAVRVLEDDPGAITEFVVVAKPGPSIGTHGAVVHNVTLIPFTWEGAGPVENEAVFKANTTEALNRWAGLSRGMITPGTVTLLDTVVTAKPTPCHAGNYANVVKTALGRGPTDPTDHWIYAPSEDMGCWWNGMALSKNEIAMGTMTLPPQPIAHELGHNFGLGHADTEPCTPGCSQSTYGNSTQVMASGFEPLNAAHATILGAFTDADTPLVTGPGTYAVKAIHEDSGVRGLRLRAATGKDYFVEYTPAPVESHSDPYWWGGLRINRKDATTAVQLDMTPGWAKNQWAVQPALLTGNTYTVPDTGLTVHLASADGTTANVIVADATADTQAPAAPADVAIPGSSTGRTDTPTFTVAWTPAESAQDDEVVGYRVTVRSETGPQWVASAPADESSASVTLPTAQGWWPTGPMTIRVQALDAAGNASDEARLDSGYQADPSPDAQAPAPPTDVTVPGSTGTWITKSFQVTWTPAPSAQDDDVIEYRATARTGDGAQVGVITTGDQTSTGTMTLPVSSGTEGPVTIAVQAVDPAGNASTEATLERTYDMSPPGDVQITYPVYGNKPLFTGPEYEVKWQTPPEAGSGLDHYEVYIDGKTAKNDIPADANSVMMPNDLPSGEHYASVVAHDKAGNKSSATKIKVWFDTVQDPKAGTNRALNQPVTVSSIHSDSYAGAKAVDGNAATRWASLKTDPTWIQIDLGKTVSIGRVILNWETAYAKAYQLQTSDDGSTWTDIHSTTTGDGKIDDIADLNGRGRYVRMYGTARGTGYGYSLWEMQVYANPQAPAMITPGSGQTVDSNDVRLGWLQPDADAVASYRLTVDGDEVTPGPAPADREWTLNLPDGEHTIQLSAVNPLGSASTPEIPITVAAVPLPPAWAAGTEYEVGDKVSYDGITYECQQAHTAQQGWEPPNSLTLWNRL